MGCNYILVLLLVDDMRSLVAVAQPPAADHQNSPDLAEESTREVLDRCWRNMAQERLYIEQGHGQLEFSLLPSQCHGTAAFLDGDDDERLYT